MQNKILPSLLMLTTITTALKPTEITLQPHEQWWTENVETKMSLFHGWLGAENALSRVAVRKYIFEKKYTSLLDIPCGLCDDFFGYKKDGITIEYYGVDITPFLVEKAKKLGINAIQGSIEKIPYPDSFVNVCYSRHILEHLEYYEKAINELIRIAEKEVIVVFFLPFAEHGDQIKIKTVDSKPIYHNSYDKEKLTQYILANKKVANIVWQNLKTEWILHINLITH